MTLQVEVERIDIGEPENPGNMTLCDINYLFFFGGLGGGGVAGVGWVCGWVVVGCSRKGTRERGRFESSAVVGPSSFKISCPEWSIGDNGCSLWLLTPCYRFKLSWIYYFTGFV